MSQWFGPVQSLILAIALSFQIQAFATGLGEVTKSSREIKVPVQLVDELESWFLKEQHRIHQVTSLSDLEIMGALHRQLLDVEVDFIAYESDALKESIHFRLPTGGGEIDLAQSIHGSKGGYKIQMKLSKLPDNTVLRVFYISNARRRTVEGEEFGSGCWKMAEMTRWFTQTHQKEPLQVYATDQRDISLVGGTWLFAAVGDSSLWLSAVTLTDSRFPQHLCNP